MMKLMNKEKVALSVITGFNLITLSASAADSTNALGYSKDAAELSLAFGLYFIGVAVCFLLAGLPFLLKRRRRQAAALFIAGTTYMVLAAVVKLAGPMLLCSTFCFAVSLTVLGIVIVTKFAPTIIAFCKKKKLRVGILIFNILTYLIPFAWIAMLIVSLADDKNKVGEAKAPTVA